MNNIRRNMSGGLRAARSYRSISRVPPARVKQRDQPLLTGGQMIAWTCLSTSFLYWIDYKGVRTEYNAKLAFDKEFQRVWEEFEASQAARHTKADNVPRDAQFTVKGEPTGLDY